MAKGEDDKTRVEGSPILSPRETIPQTTISLKGEVHTGILLKDRYLIEKMIGSGGIGIVYLARDEQLHSRPVVIKVLQQNAAQDMWIEKKFLQETEALARMNHPGVVGAIDRGRTPDGKPFLVMEFIEGIDLRTKLNEAGAREGNGLDLHLVAHIIKQVGHALSAAHNRGIYHRDLKPENIMLQTLEDEEEFVKIIDFGIATVKDSQLSSGKATTHVVGTLLYMSPEQLLGKPSALSDIYSLGVIAYELLTGRVPFEPEPVSAVNLYNMQQAGAMEMPIDLRRDLCKEAQDVILRALSFDPESRPSRAREFADELALALLAGIETVRGTTRKAKPEPEPEPEAPFFDFSEPPLEICHVLFTDIVEFSKLKIDLQLRIKQEFQQTVSSTAEYRRASQKGELITRTTGDGIVLVFRYDPVAPVRCALEVAKALLTRTHIGVRMGVHSGPVYAHKDILNSIDVAGDGINLAQRVMDSGDAGHILVSKSSAEVLSQISSWANSLQDLGLCEVKHGTLVHMFNLFTDEVGNPLIPTKLRQHPPPPPPATTPMPEAEKTIIAQILGVSFQRDPSGKEDLVYAPGPLGEIIKDPVSLSVRWQTLQANIEMVRDKIEELTWYALARQKRGEMGIEAAARELACQILPDTGFAGLLGPGVHPQFDILQDIASIIPWEVFEEHFFICAPCSKTSPRDPQETGRSFCVRCGRPMEARSNRLALSYHLTHAVRGSGRVSSEGKQFLLIEDPTGQLCSSSKDPDGVCASHLWELSKIIEQHGYSVKRLRGNEASIKEALKYIGDASTIGIYFFGFGYFSRHGEEGCIVMADGNLYASQIEEKKPAARIVFINSCGGYSEGKDWDFEKRFKSVSTAFARGGPGKIVIAPLWPMVSTQAVDMALAFFRNASLSSPLAEALKKAREESFEQYEAGEPHLAWMAYRYFGDPNKPLPTSLASERVAGDQVASALPGRLFDANDRLNTDLFSFPVDDMLFRAAKRRNLQERPQVTVTDFIGGLIRSGDLTRYLLHHRSIDPDSLYEKLRAYNEGGQPGGRPKPTIFDSAFYDTGMLKAFTGDDMSEEDLRKLLAQWFVRDREEFADDLVVLLERARQFAEHRSTQAEDRRISEHDLLMALVLDSLSAGKVNLTALTPNLTRNINPNPSWAVLTSLGFPAAEEMLELLHERQSWGEVDENGSLSLALLDPNARNIIETVHIFSQQRGVFPIPNRLMYASFLAEDNSFGSRVCKRAGLDPEHLFLLMMVATEGESSGEQPSLTFGLSLEACEWIVLPVIQEARRIASNPQSISEKDLFRAFCEMAAPAFKEWLLEESLMVDLESLKLIDPDDPLDRPARYIIEMAHRLAQRLGIFPIPNRLMLAAFLVDPEGYAARLFRQQEVSADDTCRLLIESTPGSRPRSFALSPEACARIVTPTIERAVSLSDDPRGVSERVLFMAFCQVVAPELKEALKQSSLHLDLDAFDLEEDLPESAETASATDVKSTPQLNRGTDELGIDRSQFDDGSWTVLTEAIQLTRQQGWTDIRTPHLFAALVGAAKGPLASSLKRINLHPAEMKRIVLSLVPTRFISPDAQLSVRLGENARKVLRRAVQIAALNQRAQVGEEDLLTALFADGGGVVGQLLRRFGLELPRHSELAKLDQEDSAKDPYVLSAFESDLTEKARAGKLTETVCRDEEIEAAMRALAPPENSVLVLVGEPGVGKAAIVAGIAQRIAAGSCPSELQSMRVIEMSAGGVVADTALQSRFEERVKEVAAQVRENVILFINNIHTLASTARGGEDEPEARAMIKDLLSRTKGKIIGATVSSELDRLVECKKDLFDKCNVQMIAPLSRQSTIEVLSSYRSKIEQSQKLPINEEAMVAAVDMSGRYISDRQWPAKAMDILERACAMAAGEGKTWEMNGGSGVSFEHVARLISREVDRPVEEVRLLGLAALSTLEERINKLVADRQEAVRRVAKIIHKRRLGQPGERPWASFLFASPPGSDMVEMARAIAREVYGGADSMIQLNMAEFVEPYSVAKLVGARPGRVGFDQGTPLVSRLERHPYSLLLFHEIEKAHPDVLDVLLELLSEGALKGSNGVTADGRNSIVVMTTGFFRPDQENLIRSIKHELIGLLDAIVRVGGDTVENLMPVVGQKIGEAIAQLTLSYGAGVDVGPEVMSWVAEKAARSGGMESVQRIIEEDIVLVLRAMLVSLSGTQTPHLRFKVCPDRIGLECELLGRG
jgi:ATP-dependent Clp protease ATP-binding subunit ClpC